MSISSLTILGLIPSLSIYKRQISATASYLAYLATFVSKALSRIKQHHPRPLWNSPPTHRLSSPNLSFAISNEGPLPPWKRHQWRHFPITDL
jgi:hypothetical protein